MDKGECIYGPLQATFQPAKMLKCTQPLASAQQQRSPLHLTRTSRAKRCPTAKARKLVSRRQVKVSARSGGVSEDDVDVAVFRFTLGIPGFDDRLIPRVVGAVMATLLVLNHVLGAQPAPEAQVRAEFICLLLAATCAFVPEVEARLREALPGRGRMVSAQAIPGSTNGFFLALGLSDSLRQELAWASFALLKNTNSCGVLVYHNGRAVLARGALGSGVVTPGAAEPSLAAISQELSLAIPASQDLQAVSTGSTQQLWLPDRGSMAGSVKATGWASLPAGAECLLLQHIPIAGKGQALLALWSERPRALSDRERIWADSISKKLAAFLAQ